MLTHLSLSGDLIVITDDFAVKTCRTNQSRFLRNAHKQASFANPIINAVPIIDQGTTDGYHWIRMPYLACDNALEWISRASITSIGLFGNQIVEYLSCLLRKSEIRPFDCDAWQSKIDDLLTRITNDTVVDVLRTLRDWRFANGFYYGDYHGDLTLANLLISDGDTLSIDAVDFLDCFLASPIWDVVKMRQDTHHLWTLHLLKDKGFDANKICIALNYLDERLKRLIADDPILTEYYLPFQILNLIRILPYNHDANIEAYLWDEIDALYTMLLGG